MTPPMHDPHEAKADAAKADRTVLRGSENGNRYSPSGREILTGVTRTMIDVTAPRPAQIYMADIARSLARQQRFTGHCPLQPTVAQHSVAVALLVQEMASSRSRVATVAELRAALMHDAAEMIVSDLNGAVKKSLRGHARSSVQVESWFDTYESRAERAIVKRFDCADTGHEAAVHEGDVLACAYEMAWGGWCEEAHPPEWVVTLLDAGGVYRAADGGELDFLRCAAVLGMYDDGTLGDLVARGW